ncbi:MAG: M23 family metallopeptidase [Clostridia bacterium]
MIYQNPYRGNYRVSCAFKVPGSWAAGYHIGVDLVGEDKKLYPICAGIVQSLNSKGSAYGNHILIKQDDGKVSVYAHLSKINVLKGDKVALNTNIGTEGSTGNSTGSHLHLELHDGEYDYPSRTEDAFWLLDPIGEIENNQSLNTTESVAIIMENANISQATIDFLMNYRYGDALVQKLAKAICIKSTETLSDIAKVKQTAQLTDETITFLECYKYSDSLFEKLASAMS